MNMATLKIFSGCRYIASPFTSLEDLSWRLLLRKFGVHLCFTDLTRAQDCIENADSLFGSLPRLEDRPLVVQLIAEDADSLVAAVSGLKDLCDAVDITDYSNSSSNKNDSWNAWLSCIQKVQQECKMPILCKLPFSQQTVDDTIRKGNILQQAGCKLLLLHKHRTGTANSIVTKKDWDSVKTICESVSLQFILDVGSSSLWDIDKCLQYTGVQGVAVSDSLEANPALFCKKQPAVLDVVNEYLELCGEHPTPLANIKRHLSGFLGYYLSRFHNISTKLEDVETIEEVQMLVHDLKKDMSLLSKSEMKSLVRLKRKKENYKRKHLSKMEERTFTKESETPKENGDHISKIVLKKIQKERVENAMRNGGQRVAIDFTLSEDMSNKEVTKLAAQVRQLYGSNMKSVLPVHLHLTGLGTNGRVYRECVRQSLDFDKLMVYKSESSYLRMFETEEIVYLTPDSPNVLESLDRDKVYIIGGLVDHHVLKDRTKTRAENENVVTARFPIDVYMERKSEPGNHSFSKVLTVNQVFDILLKYYETKDWRCALETCIPPRKGLVLKQP